jgi:general secretion pathway protein D
VPGANGTQTYTVSTVNGLIKALAEANNANILATPQILVTDNTEGVFEAGETIPTRQISSPIGGAQTTGAGTPQNIKMSLKITPQINKATRFIKLKIDQRVEDINGEAQADIGAPTTIRTAVTEVVVRDQDTIAMGGLMRDKDTSGEHKIPLLGDVPVLGWLFKMKSQTKIKTNLIFFLTPKIIDPYERAAASNTKQVISKRVKSLKGFIDDKDIYNEALSELSDKVDQQARGPLYETNENAPMIDNKGPVSKDQLAGPEYSKLNEEDLNPSVESETPATDAQTLPAAGTQQ